MIVIVNEQLAALLERNRDAVCEAWAKRLSDPALLAASKLQPGVPAPVRPLLTEVVLLLRAEPLALRVESTQALLEHFGPSTAWHINLSQAIEVLLTGEVVIRYWARAYLNLADGELLALFEELNRIFHQLIRDYALRYCDRCHAVQQTLSER